MSGHWLPLFPLHTVLFPHMPLGLHVFEPRYRLMISECLGAGHSFGVVAIREGSETGPAIPHDVGTLAKIVRVERLEDGRMNLQVTGASRFQIVRTARDRPYLRGEVRFLPETGDDLQQTSHITEAAGTAYRDYCNLLRELVDQQPEPAEPPMEPELLSYLIAAALNAQIPAKQALLALPRTDERLQAELQLLRKDIALLRAMLARKEAGLSRRASLN